MSDIESLVMSMRFYSIKQKKFKNNLLNDEKVVKQPIKNINLKELERLYVKLMMEMNKAVDLQDSEIIYQTRERIDFLKALSK